MRATICSFSSPATELKKKDRTNDNVLAALAKFPRISTFDMSEHYKWLQPILSSLKTMGLIKDEAEPYPWHRYSLTDAGKKRLGISA